MRTVRIKVTRSVDKWWRFCCFGRLFEVIPSSGENSFQIHCRSSFENQLQMICKWSANDLQIICRHKQCTSLGFYFRRRSLRLMANNFRRESHSLASADRVCRSGLHRIFTHWSRTAFHKEPRRRWENTPHFHRNLLNACMLKKTFHIRRVWWPNFGNWTLVRTKFLRRNLNCFKRLNSALAKKYHSAKWWITL